MHRMIIGSYDIDKNIFRINCSGVHQYKTEEIELYICGEIWVNHPDRINQEEEIVAAFVEDPNTFTERIRGMYIALFYQKIDKTIYVYHDRNTSPLPFYYCSTNSKVVFGTSLKRILAYSQINRELNNDVICSFFENGTVLGEHTLLKNVYKIAPFSAVKMSSESIAQFEVFYPINEYTEDEAKEMWEPTLEKIIASYIADNKSDQEICMTLSSGYDSNYILYVISKYRNKKQNIHAFSLGGKQGINELPTVKENIKHFDNITLTTKVVDNASLNRFPDIVWRMEGLIYERGVFLHHELAELLSNSGVETIIGGDGMDQVLLEKYYEENRETTNDSNTRMDFQRTPYSMFSSLYIKKNGVLANSYGVTQRFPYVDDRFIDIAHATTSANGLNKLYHKEICKKSFIQDIYNSASKVGGATEAQAFFDDYRQIRKFYKMVENTDAYMKYYEIINKNKKDKCFQFMWRMLRSVLVSIRYRQNRFKTFLIRNKENKLQDYLKYLYLDLFIILFISGKYDLYFSEEGIDCKLEDIYS